MLMVSGITSVNLYPLAALTNARATPVLPLVASRMVISFLMRPRFSASSSMATPMRSFTLLIGLKDSSLAATVAPAPRVMRFEPDQRGIADRGGDIVVNFCHVTAPWYLE